MHHVISKNLQSDFAAMHRCVKSRQLQVAFARGFAAESSTLIPRYHKILILCISSMVLFFVQGITFGEKLKLLLSQTLKIYWASKFTEQGAASTFFDCIPVGQTPHGVQPPCMGWRSPPSPLPTGQNPTSNPRPHRPAGSGRRQPGTSPNY